MTCRKTRAFARAASFERRLQLTLVFGRPEGRAVELLSDVEV